MGIGFEAAWLLLIPESPGSSPAISNFYEEYLFTVRLFRKEKRPGMGIGVVCIVAYFIVLYILII